MKVIIILLITTFVIGCNSQTKERNMEVYGSIKSNGDTLYVRYLPLMKKLLNANDFRALNHNDFKNKIIDYFGVDIDSTKFNDVYLEKGLGFIALREERFIDTYQVDRGVIDGAGDVFAEILQEGINNGYNDVLVNYNKVLFNDDQIEIFKTSKNIDKTEDIVVYLNYEKNNLLNDFLVKN